MPDESSVGKLFVPPFRRRSRAWKLCLSTVRSLAAVGIENDRREERLGQIRARSFAEAAACGDHEQLLRVVLSVLCDLGRQGWRIRPRKDGVWLARPSENDIDLETLKSQIRASLAVERDQQLREPAVRTFVRGMERRHIGPTGWVSIFSLMRDGRQLACGLREALARSDERERLAALKLTVDPYLQVVTSDAICNLTGYRLSDIWRYFRHTWANSYQSSVGREIKVLIRDRAVEHHPVVGIGSLVSPRHLVHVDRWIGWDSKQFLQRLSDELSMPWAKWIHSSLDELISDIYTKDLISAGVLERKHLRSPVDSTITRLAEEAKSAQAAHKLHPDKALHKSANSEGGDTDWVERAKTYLYRGKRSSALSELLAARLALREVGFAKPSKDGLRKALATPHGRRAIDTIRRYIKSVYAGIGMLDIAICGAVAPYSHILGGKLVAMLLASPEVAQAYYQTYRSSASVIASAVAGRPVCRKPYLVALTTSSLYGQYPNQYTRISIPSVEVGGDSTEAVRYYVLGRTQGKGTHHITSPTVEEIELLLSQRADGHRIHSIFGEGTNPRMRKVRSGLDACHLPADYVLNHGSPRVLYGIGLASNFRECLIGREKRPKYVLPSDDPADMSAKIVDYWRKRWLSKRIEKEDALMQVSEHTLVSPIEHGARVELPVVYEEAPLLHGIDG